MPLVPTLLRYKQSFIYIVAVHSPPQNSSLVHSLLYSNIIEYNQTLSGMFTEITNWWVQEAIADVHILEQMNIRIPLRDGILLGKKDETTNSW